MRVWRLGKVHNVSASAEGHCCAWPGAGISHWSSYNISMACLCLLIALLVLFYYILYAAYGFSSCWWSWTIKPCTGLLTARQLFCALAEASITGRGSPSAGLYYFYYYCTAIYWITEHDEALFNCFSSLPFRSRTFLPQVNFVQDVEYPNRNVAHQLELKMYVLICGRRASCFRCRLQPRIRGGLASTEDFY